MDSLTNVVQSILNMGSSVVLPIIMFIVGIVFRVPLKKAIISGLTVGIGMIGINLVINLLTTSVGPAAQAMVERFGLNLTIIDAGWPTVAAGTWAQPIAAVMIPIILIVNLIMLAMNWTKTLNIDIWNYWHMSAAAATGYIVTNNFLFGIICGIIYTVFVQIIADKTAPKMQEYYGLEGVSLPTGSAQGYAVLAIPIGWLIDRIPGINKLDVKPETIQKRFGIFGEPMIMGIIIGVFLGLLGGYDIAGILQIGMTMGGVMFLMPRMVKILMEGLIPIQESAQKMLQSRYGDREIYLGMDAALATGSPAALSTGLLMVPITLFLAVILPGNRVLPFGDLATIPFFAALVVPSRKGNILHSVLSLTVVIALALLMATDYAPTLTTMAEGIVEFPEGAAQISNLDTGGNILNWIFLKLAQLVNSIM
ncbi:PTS galactitol transporter subunit IIC [Candidatus Enterococcus ferrettii]|uniref:PTS system, galactitol-specific IIC component n=1 Tax=Candidatus Enterococcus ferrettii TaxID=2815324 RepID=A0ABV0EKE7_9ENTE|nr:PTS transporter subunit IIC [Enterococcus sp. 665A]MBO1341572.1 PTS galactitol transporter subunit IIC [Enterococcus sp. 665A]